MSDDLFGTLAEMELRRKSQFESFNEKVISQFREFSNTFYYPQYKALLHEQLADLDRQDVNDAGVALRVQGQRQAIRKILDHLGNLEGLTKDRSVGN